MKDFVNSAAAKLLKKAVEEEASRSFFSPKSDMEYTVSPNTKKVKIKDKTYERLVLVDKNGLEHLVDARNLVQICLDITDKKVYETQKLAEVEQLLATAEAVKFEEVADCYLFGKKLAEGAKAPEDAELYTANSGNTFILRKAKELKVVAAE